MGFRCAPMDAAKVKLSSYHGLSAHLHSGQPSTVSCDLSSTTQNGNPCPKKLTIYPEETKLF